MTSHGSKVFDSREAPRSIGLMRAWLATGADLMLDASGGSMSPTYRDGDRLRVRAISETHPLQPDDVVVFERAGRLVAHRLVRVRSDGRLLTQGDFHGESEEPVDPRDVIGRVVSHTRAPRARGAMGPTRGAMGPARGAMGKRLRLPVSWQSPGALLQRALSEARTWATASQDLVRPAGPPPVMSDGPRATTPTQVYAIQHLARETVSHAASALRSAGIPFLVIKGMASAALLYDDPLQRPYSDVDVLVRWRDVARAWAALGRAGWDRKLVSSHLFEASHPRVPAIQLDGQGHAGFPLAPRGGVSALLQDSETFVLRAHANAESFVALPTAGRDAMPAVLAMFVVRDIASGYGGAEPERDLPRAIDRASSQDAMWKRAEELGLDRALLAAIDSVCPERLPDGPRPWWLPVWRNASKTAPSVRTVGQRRARLLGTALLAGGARSMGALFTEMAVTKAVRGGANALGGVLRMGR